MPTVIQSELIFEMKLATLRLDYLCVVPVDKTQGQYAKLEAEKSERLSPEENWSSRRAKLKSGEPLVTRDFHMRAWRLRITVWYISFMTSSLSVSFSASEVESPVSPLQGL